MCFAQLHESARRGELLLVAGGMCHWHLRRDGQLTIREIIATHPGAGRAMLATLRNIAGARTVLAKCPSGLPSNRWYERMGFRETRQETARSGRVVRVWELALC